MVHIYIGDGKGKTTAALGLAMRAAGWGKKVYIAQFLKSKKFPCGELQAINKNKINIKLERFEDQTHPMFLKSEDRDLGKIKKSVDKCLTKIEEYIEKSKFDLIILDELLDVYKLGVVTKTRIKRIITKSKKIELVITGREADLDIKAKADYISLIKKVKHPYDKKIRARKAIEY